jgi:DeoR family fructose operon transcriptional repressor
MGSSIKIFTKGLAVAQEFAHVPSIELTLIGGRARIEKLSTVGSAASSMMEELWCDCLFLGKKAIDVEEELISLDAEEAAINAQMVRRSARVTDFADSSKFGSRVTHSAEQLAIGHTPTSEAEPTGEFAKYIERSGVNFAPAETEKSQQVIHA